MPHSTRAPLARTLFLALAPVNWPSYRGGDLQLSSVPEWCSFWTAFLCATVDVCDNALLPALIHKPQLLILEQNIHLHASVAFAKGDMLKTAIFTVYLLQGAGNLLEQAQQTSEEQCGAIDGFKDILVRKEVLSHKDKVRCAGHVRKQLPMLPSHAALYARTVHVSTCNDHQQDAGVHFM